MFEQTFVDTQTRARQPWSLAASAAVQTGLVGLLLIIPLLHPEGPMMRLDGPPVVYRPMTMAPIPVVIPAGSKIARPTGLVFSSALTAPRTVPTGVVRITDAPEFVGEVGSIPSAVGDAINTLIGAIPKAGVPAVVKPPATVVETPQPPAAPLRVSTNVQAALLIFGPKPVYPPLARATRQQGRVRLQAIVGADGAIRNLRLISGPPLLVESALEAVGRWRYRPTILNGVPVEVTTEVEVNFTLSQ